MILGIAEDFSSNVSLDSELTSLPTGGIYLNSGVHPSITLENLLYFLPDFDSTFAAYDEAKTYGKYSDSRSKSDLVISGGKIFQSLAVNNTGNVPASNPAKWLETNIESLRIKSFLAKVKDKVLADLSLTKRLVNNQYFYNIGAGTISLPEDYCGWVFEPKGSDYIKFCLNEISLQKTGTTPVNLYVINQGVLVETLQVTPQNGALGFTRLDYEFSGKGKWMFVIDSTNVIGSASFVDPLKYDGFIAYTCVGRGASPETASYSYGYSGNGLGVNISAFLDASVYIENNFSGFAPFIRAAFEFMCFQVFLHNSNNRSNRAQRIQMNDQLLIAEVKDTTIDSVVSRYHKEQKKAMKILERTFDTQLSQSNDMDVYYSSL